MSKHPKDIMADAERVYDKLGRGANQDVEVIADALAAERDGCAGRARAWLENEASDLQEIRDGYIEARSSGHHAGRKIADDMAKRFAQEFRNRSDAVSNCVEHVQDAILGGPNAR